MIIILRQTIVVVLACLYLPLAAETVYYRWLDESGKTHYSYSIPADKAKLGHVQLDKQGLEKKKVVSEERKKQLQKIAELRKKEEEQSRIDNEKKRIQKAEDGFLLSIFSSEDELVQSYESKLKLAQITIDLLKDRHEKQSEKLEAFEQTYERAVDIKHKQLMEKRIEAMLDNLKIYQRAITENQIEKDKVSVEYRESLARFKKLFLRIKAAQ